MASNQQYDDAIKRIKELNNEIKRLGGDGFANLDKLTKSFNGDITSANSQIKLMVSEVDSLRNVFDDLGDTVKNALDDLKGTENVIQDINKGYNKFEKTARKVAEHRRDEEVLTVKQLKNLHKQLTIEFELLKEKKTSIRKELSDLNKKDKLTTAERKKQKKLIDYYNEVTSAVKEKGSYLQEIVDLTSEEVQKEKELQKTLGITGQLFKGIAGTLSKIGIESESIDEISKSMRTAAKTGSGFKVIGAAVSGIFSTLKDSLLNDPAVQLAVLGKIASTLYTIGTETSLQTAEIARNLGVSTATAQKFNAQMREVSMNSHEAAQSMQRTRESNAQLNEALGTSVVYSQQQLDTQTALVHRAGLQASEAAKIAEYSILTGESQEGVYRFKDRFGSFTVPYRYFSKIENQAVKELDKVILSTHFNFFYSYKFDS